MCSFYLSFAFFTLLLPLDGPNQYFVCPQIFSAYNAGAKMVKVRLIIFFDVKVLKLIQAVANFYRSQGGRC